MTQIEDIAGLVFKDGMTEQDFFQQMFAELMLRNRAVAQKISIEEAKREKGKDGLCDYELWKKGFIRSAFKSKGLIKHPADIYNVLNNAYNYRRYTNFPDYTDAERKRMKVAMVDTADVHGFGQGGFYFRMLHGWKKTRHSFARFQINADMNPKMIKDLDNFIKRHNSVYKMTPIDEWSGRTDTVNIYMYEPMTETIKKEIVQVMAPYIRRSKPSHINAIDGELLADGIAFARTATPEELKALVNRYPQHLRQEVRNYFSGGVSLGVVRTAEEFLDMYQRYAPRLRDGKGVVTQNPRISKVPVVRTQPISDSHYSSSRHENSPSLTIQDLLKEMRAARSELAQLRRENALLEKNVFGLEQENARLSLGNKLLSSQKRKTVRSGREK